VVLSEDGTPIRPKGVMSWFQAKMEEAQAQQVARKGAVTVDEDVEETPVKAAPRPVKKNSRKQPAKSLQEQVDADVESDAQPVKTNGHSAKNAPRRTRSTRKTTQSG
jgi:hypothetical protein